MSLKMYFHVFNKKPSRKGIERAMVSSDAEEQAQTLAAETAPVKGEIWQNEMAACWLFAATTFSSMVLTLKISWNVMA